MSTNVNGAGVDPNEVIRPSKRIRNLYRQSDVVCGLKMFARLTIKADQVVNPRGPLGPDAVIAARWFANKAG